MYNGTTAHLSDFCDLIFEPYLNQLVLSTTHKVGNILDLVLTNNDELIHDVSIHTVLPDGLLPDFIIKFCIVIAMDHHVPTPVLAHFIILEQMWDDMNI